LCLEAAAQGAPAGSALRLDGRGAAQGLRTPRDAPVSRDAESLRRRRERLVAEAEAQREALARAVAELDLPLKMIDAGIRIGGLARRRNGGSPGIARLRPAAGRVLAIGWRLFVLWQAARLGREIVAEARGVRTRIRLGRWQ